MPRLIEAEQLSRSYGDRLAVDGLSFHLDQGEILGFLGPNGAGKSSTLHMLSGNLAPSSGRVRIAGIDLLDRPQKAKAHLGYLPEIPPIHRDLTVDEFLIYCARLHGLTHDQALRAVDHARERTGLACVGQRLIGNLSKGYQQRVGIAQAIVHNPAVILLDEPTVGLDPIQIREIRQLIRELGREHAILLSTHILSEVQESCTRVLIIHQGRLVLNESLCELERRMKSSSMILATRQAADPEALAHLPGVRGVEPLGDARWRIVHDTDACPTDALATLVLSKGWGLTELSPDRRGIEQLFVELTRTEAA